MNVNVVIKAAQMTTWNPNAAATPFMSVISYDGHGIKLTAVSLIKN
jgi:hypothetical protein